VLGVDSQVVPEFGGKYMGLSRIVWDCTSFSSVEQPNNNNSTTDIKENVFMA
jgi:hypothetical protein